MNELVYNKELTVRHVMNTDFERRMFDLYIGCGTEKRPPYLEEIFREASRFQAIYVLESIREQPDTLLINEEEWSNLEQGVMQDDDDMKMEVLDRVSAHEIDNVIHDILLYFNKYRLSVIMGMYPGSPVYASKLMFPPTLEVW